MKFKDFRLKALALLSICPMRVSDLARATGTTSAPYLWIKKMAIAGEVIRQDDGLYRLATNEELSDAFVEERITEVEVTKGIEVIKGIAAITGKGWAVSQ